LKLSSFDKNTVTNNKVSDIVRREYRTHLIHDTNILQQMKDPCLFIVGSRDSEIIKINKKTMGKINTNVETKIQIIERASHLFEEEEGKIEKVAEIAGKWFLKFL
jgi:hypothetical protein